jgi:hypothetical protein
MNMRRNVLWMILGGIGFLCVLILFIIPVFQREGGSKSKPSSSMASSGPSLLNNDKDTYPIPKDAYPIPSPDIASISPGEEKEKEKVQSPSPPPLPEQAVPEKFRQKWAEDVDARLRTQTIGLYGGLFRKLGLSEDVQAQVIDILTEQQREMEQQAFAAARFGTLPDSPPSSETMQAKQAQQDQQLRSVLGQAGFAAFDQYRTTLPDRMAIDSMNQQGAGLNESQSEQLRQVLTETRQQFINQSWIAAQNLDSMPQENVVATIQHQEALLQQAVRDRTQNLISPEQATLLQNILSQQISPALGSQNRPH